MCIATDYAAAQCECDSRYLPILIFRLNGDLREGAIRTSHELFGGIFLKNGLDAQPRRSGGLALHNRWCWRYTLHVPRGKQRGRVNTPLGAL